MGLVTQDFYDQNISKRKSMLEVHKFVKGGEIMSRIIKDQLPMRLEDKEALIVHRAILYK